MDGLDFETLTTTARAYLTQPENILSMFSTAGTAVLALISWNVNVNTRKRQNRMQIESLRLQLDSQRISWGGEVIDELSRSEMLAAERGRAFGPERLIAERAELRANISAETDRGRLYFPNVLAHEVGVSREAAFQGYRRSILDCMVLVYATLERIDPSATEPAATEADFIRRCRRQFVSELQAAIGRERLSLSPSDEDERTTLESVEAPHSWDAVAKLVDEYETRYGDKTFWNDRPPVTGESHPYAIAQKPRGVLTMLMPARLRRQSTLERV